jgi:hypothetical protein
MKAQLTLTPEESKRLIAKAVAAHDSVREALERGIVAIATGTTNAYVVEELLGREIEKGRYVAGFIDEKGPCVVPGEERLEAAVFVKGREEALTVEEALQRMGPGDVFIKGGNALDPEGTVGVMLASETGGTIARILGPIKARGIRFLLPIGLEKLIPFPVTEASQATGIETTDYSTGVPVGLMPVSGEVITEIEAFEILTGTWALPFAAGGIGDGGGSRTFLVEGGEEGVREAIALVEGIKGEGKVSPRRGRCRECAYRRCPFAGRKDLPGFMEG